MTCCCLACKQSSGAFIHSFIHPFIARWLHGTCHGRRRAHSAPRWDSADDSLCCYSSPAAVTVSSSSSCLARRIAVAFWRCASGLQGWRLRLAASHTRNRQTHRSLDGRSMLGAHHTPTDGLPSCTLQITTNCAHMGPLLRRPRAPASLPSSQPLTMLHALCAASGAEPPWPALTGACSPCNRLLPADAHRDAGPQLYHRGEHRRAGHF